MFTWMFSRMYTSKQLEFHEKKSVIHIVSELGNVNDNLNSEEITIKLEFGLEFRKHFRV